MNWCRNVFANNVFYIVIDPVGVARWELGQESQCILGL